MDPLTYNEVRSRPSLEERLESIISGAALMADSSCTRDDRRERIVQECNAVRQALQDLLTEYMSNVSSPIPCPNPNQFARIWLHKSLTAEDWHCGTGSFLPQASLHCPDYILQLASGFICGEVDIGREGADIYRSLLVLFDLSTCCCFFIQHSF